MSAHFDVCVIPGDGIGPEVTDCAVRVLEALEAHGGPSFTVSRHQAGHRLYEETGESLPHGTVEAAKAADSVLLGAIDVAQLPPGVERPLVALRRLFEVGASIRPSRSYPGATNQRDDVDVLMVREVTEGLYSHVEYRTGPDAACAVRIVSRTATARTARIAFEQASGRRGKVTAVHKLGALPVTDGLFIDTIADVATDFPDIEWDHRNVDACALEMIRHPAEFDVILATNAFGDILSDVGAGLAGGLGLAPSGCVGARWSYFEPVHGSAPDIAGRGIANPIATILSASMMVRHLGDTDAADRIDRAVASVLRSGSPRTGDLGGSASSTEMTDAIIDALEG